MYKPSALQHWNFHIDVSDANNFPRKIPIYTPHITQIRHSKRNHTNTHQQSIALLFYSLFSSSDRFGHGHFPTIDFPRRDARTESGTRRLPVENRRKNPRSHYRDGFQWWWWWWIYDSCAWCTSGLLTRCARDALCQFPRCDFHWLLLSVVKGFKWGFISDG